MSKFTPAVNYAAQTDHNIAAYALDAAAAAFLYDTNAGLTNGDSLVIVVGCIEDGNWCEQGRREFGPDAAEFAKNIDPQTGKLATALQYLMDSGMAYHLYDDEIPKGPQRFTGGVFHSVRVETAKKGWMTRNFAGAASGVQGHMDAATVYTALTRMGAMWALKMQALHDKPSST